MKAKTTSLHAKLYEFTYESNLPSNLCPYFWKLVIASILFIPNFILQLPAHIYGFIIPKDKEYRCFSNMGKGLFLYIAMLIVSSFLCINYHLIRSMLNCYSYDSSLAGAGRMIDSAIMCVILYYLIKSWYDKRPKTYKEKTPNIIVEFIKAKKSKYCPKIDWE